MTHNIRRQPVGDDEDLVGYGGRDLPGQQTRTHLRHEMLDAGRIGFHCQLQILLCLAGHCIASALHEFQGLGLRGNQGDDPGKAGDLKDTLNCRFGTENHEAAMQRAYLPRRRKDNSQTCGTRSDLLAAIGDYHSHTITLNYQYQSQVIGAAWSLFGQGTRARQ